MSSPGQAPGQGQIPGAQQAAREAYQKAADYAAQGQGVPVPAGNASQDPPWAPVDPRGYDVANPQPNENWT